MYKTLRKTLIVGSLASIFMLETLMTPAVGHEALHWSTKQPMGWHYDPKCCDGRDCQMINPETVKIVPQGYEVTLQPDEHKMLTRPRTFFIHFLSDKVRVSGDTEYHICISPDTIPGTTTTPRDGTEVQSKIYCFYIPPNFS